MEATGGAAPYTITDANGDFVSSVNWQAPALNTVLLRFDEEEVFDILVYGRPFSPMPAWGIEGGGALNDQQIDEPDRLPQEIQISPEEAQAAGRGGPGAGAMAAASSPAEGEALFNLGLYDGFAGGAYSCGRCHTQGWSYGEPEADGTGAFGPNLTAVRQQFPGGAAGFAGAGGLHQRGLGQGQAYGVHGQGSGRMPGFGEMLTEEQIQAIVEYERNLGMTDVDHHHRPGRDRVRPGDPRRPDLRLRRSCSSAAPGGCCWGPTSGSRLGFLVAAAAPLRLADAAQPLWWIYGVGASGELPDVEGRGGQRRRHQPGPTRGGPRPRAREPPSTPSRSSPTIPEMADGVRRGPDPHPERDRRPGRPAAGGAASSSTTSKATGRCCPRPRSVTPRPRPTPP